MKGFLKKTLMTLVAAACLYAPCTLARALDLKHHDEKPVIFQHNARRGHGAAPQGLVPPMGQDLARQAVQEGEILPLSDIRRLVHDQFGGKIVGVDLAQGHEDKNSDPLWIYDIRVLSPEGRVVSVQMDASDGRVLDVRGQR